MNEIVMADDWRQHLNDAVFGFFDERLGPDMLADMQRSVPVDTGRLLGSLDFHVTGLDAGWELQVGSFPDADGDVEYAAPVELGFRGPEIVHAHLRRGHAVREFERNGYTPEQPYMRPALYRERY